MRHILIDTSPLANDNAHRGVGAYTRLLIEQLQQSDKLQLYTSGVGVPPGVKIDLVHYPFFDLFFPTLPFFKKTKTVVTVHDVIPLKFPDHYRPGKKGSLNLIRQSLAVRKADAIITDSESSKSDIHHFLKISNSKIFTIPLAANPELKKTDRETTRQVMTELDMPSDYILYVGDIN